MADQMQQRRDTAANWTSVNPVLAQGELGIEIDAVPIRFKIGNGTQAWAALSYAGSGGSVVAALDDLTDVTVTAAASGDIIRYNGTAWVDATGTTFFETAGAVNTHNASTVSVHGVADMSALETTAGATAKAAAAQTAATTAAASDATTKANAAQTAAATDATSKVTVHTAAADPHADRAYTDAQIAASLSTAFDFKASVRAATTGNITLSGAQTIDGVSVVATNRVLAKDQTIGSERGIYVAASGAWTRSTDADISAEVTAGMSVPVEEGTVSAGLVYLLTTPNPITLDTTALTFSLVGSGDLKASNNLTDVTSPATALANLGGVSTAALTAHEIETTDVHGIVNTAVLETTTGSAAKVAAHEVDTTSVHGIANTAFLETQAGAQTKVDTLEDALPAIYVESPDLRHDLVVTLAEYNAIVTKDPATRYTISDAVGLDAHLSDATDAHDASAISFVPTGTIAATTVQAAIVEVAAEAAGVTNLTYTAASTNGVVVSDTGTDATLTLADGTNAGLMTPANFTKLATAYVPSGTDVAVVDGGTGSSTAAGARTNLGLGNLATATALTEYIGVAVSDETTTITTGNAKVTFRMPFAMTVTAVRANLTTASSSGIPTVDINEGGTSILSTKLTIDASELTSTTAATAAAISDSALADDAPMTIDVDVAGTGAKGLKIWLIGTRVV